MDTIDLGNSESLVFGIRRIPPRLTWLKAGTQHESARRSSSHCTVSLNLIRPCASGCGNPRNGAAVSMAGLFLPR
ncbi:TPA: hypothetical protein J1072_003537 [Escherichia coli]|nr:hypothetical protein [Escherichia coli]